MLDNELPREEMKLNIPSEEILREFAKKITPELKEQIRKSLEENKTIL